ncbi:MAG: hypothetical protein ACI84O_000181 [Myxococcota bacterium]|jgi:hypothetical protein
MFLSRLTIVLISSLLSASCGILFPGPSLPSKEKIAAAKVQQQREWSLLEFGLEVLDADLSSGQLIMYDLIRNNPQLPRLPLLLQDIQLQQLDSSALIYEYEQLEAQRKSAISALLLARLQPNRELRLMWANTALERDPNMILAEVFALGTRANGGDVKVLSPLVRLLDANPGCAEGWRLLSQLAPVYARADYAAAAAETEPWSTATLSQTHADKSAAVAALQAHYPQLAIDSVVGLRDETFTKLVTAAAYAQQQHGEDALRLINEILSVEPENVIAIYNRAILLRDYLSRSGDAISDLEKFLDLTAENPQEYLRRRSQAEFWLEER